MSVKHSSADTKINPPITQKKSNTIVLRTAVNNSCHPQLVVHTLRRSTCTLTSFPSPKKERKLRQGCKFIQWISPIIQIEPLMLEGGNQVYLQWPEGSVKTSYSASVLALFGWKHAWCSLFLQQQQMSFFFFILEPAVPSGPRRDNRCSSQPSTSLFNTMQVFKFIQVMWRTHFSSTSRAVSGVLVLKPA